MKFKFRDYAGGIIICLLSMFAVIGTVHGQNRLNADLVVPGLEVENGAKTFRVRINKSPTQACNSATLVLNIPSGFQYTPGSAKIGADVLEESIVGNKVTLTLPNIETGNGYLEVAYNLGALCEAIGKPAAERAVSYELHSCGQMTPETKKSNTINLEAAVLNLTVTPTITVGLIGDEIVRTIKVTNAGTAGITNAKIDVDYGAGIELQKNEASLPTGLKYSASGYVYENNLPSGGTITFTEKVRIIGCAGLESNYNAFYGADCNGGGVDNTLGKAETIVRIDDTKKPNVVVTDISDKAIICLGGTFNHKWLIKNTGNAPASALEIVIGAGIISTGPTVAGGVATVAGKTVTISVLLPGEERVITFTQQYDAPTGAGECSNLPTNYNTESTSYTLRYKHAAGCIDGKTPEYTAAGTTKGSLKFAFAGDNVGEADIVGGQGYGADFKIGTWSFPETGLDQNARLEIKIDLSSNLTLNASALKLFNGSSDVSGVTITPSGTSYVITIPREALISGTEGNWRLKFPLALNCPTDAPAYYTITSTLHNCASAITFQCQTVSLNGHCPVPSDCPEGGMANEGMTFKRITLGLEDTDNDGKPNSSNPAVVVGESIRSFVAGDIVEISQDGTVIAPMGANEERNNSYLWKNGGRFVVSVDDANLGLSEGGRVGKVIITRGTETITLDNLLVKKDNGKFYIDFPATAATFTGFQTGDKVVASLQLKAMKANGTTGLKRFSTQYWLNNDANAAKSCGGGYRVNGYYGATALNVDVLNPIYNLPICSSGQEGAGLKIDFSVIENNFRNALFPNEFREIAKPKSVSLTVSAGLILTGYRVELLGNGASPTSIDVTGLNISGATHTINAATLQGHLSKLKSGNTVGVIDEGFTFILRPIVTPKCSETILRETIKVTSTADGSFHYNGKDYIDAKDVALNEQTLTYNTDNNKIEVNIIQANITAYTNEAQWLVRVTNRSDFRAFENFWLRQSDNKTTATISRIKEITSLGDMTTPPGGLGDLLNQEKYELGELSANETRYFLVTATLKGCTDGAVSFAYGTSCHTVPSETCEKQYAQPLTFKLVNPILQTTVLDDPGQEQLSICDPITYVVEINNAGGKATDVKLRIDMAFFLEYVGVAGQVTASADMSGVYSMRPESGNIVFDKVVPNVVVAGDSAVIIIPATHLPDGALQNAERFYLRFQLAVKNCEFKSGQTITLTPAAKNHCGTPVTGKGQIMEAGTERIILKGAPGNLPIVDLGGIGTTNLTPSTSSGTLTATYTAEITNTGGAAGNHPVTGTGSSQVYKYALKLPENWVIDGLTAGDVKGKLTYVGLDVNKGYVFAFNSDLTHLEKTSLAFQMRYTGDVKKLTCTDPKFTFGNIYQELYTDFKVDVTGCKDNDKFNGCGLSELLIKDQTIPFDLTQSSPIVAEQEFCIDNKAPKLFDVIISKNEGIVEWYRDADLKIRVLDPAKEDMYATYLANNGTPLIAGEVKEVFYYITNRLVDGSECKSPATKVTVVLVANPISNAGPNQLKYNVGEFTLAGNEPNTSRSTQTGNKGVWSVKSGTATIDSPTLYSSKVTIPVGTTAVLKWTVKNECTTVESEVTLVSQKATLKLTKQQVGLVGDKDSDNRHSVGDEIRYQFIIENTGDVTLKAPFTIEDAKLGWTGANVFVIPGLTELAAKATRTFEAPIPYVITLNEMNAAKVINTAQVTAKTPEIPTDSKTGPIDIESDKSSVTTPLVPVTGLELIKSITAIGGNSKVGDQITYTFKVTNTGNVSVHTLQLTDVKLGLTNSGLNFDPVQIDPGQTATGTRNYKLTQADLDAGFILNTATITGTPIPKNGTKPSDVSDTGTDRTGAIITDPGADGRHDDPTILDLIQRPGIKLEKTGVYNGNKDRAEVGDKVEYTFAVTNTGNVTLTDIVLTDADFSGEGVLSITGPVGNPNGNTAAKLAPNVTLTYNAVYTLTQKDIDAGELINQALVTANPPVGLDPSNPLPPVTDKSSDPNDPTKPEDGKTIVPIPQSPSIGLVKSYKEVIGFRYVGDKIEYKIVVSNTGNVTLTNVVVTDDNADTKAIGTIAELKVGASQTFTAYHTITEADMIRGYVSNIAKAVGEDPNKENVTAESKSGNPVDPNGPTDPKCVNCTVTPLPWPKIVAKDDILPAVNGKEGNVNAGNVLVDNSKGEDTLNGNPTTVTEVKVTVKTPAKPIDSDNVNKNVPVLNGATGQVSVPENTPAGNYSIVYTICELKNLLNCDEATVTIVVKPAPIVAEDDNFGPFNGKDGGKTPPVTNNDTLNGKPINPKDITVKPGTPVDENGKPTGKITMTPDGVITIAPETPAGEYKFPYTICEVLNPKNCDDAIVTIVVDPAPIEAEDDNFGPFNGKDGGKTPPVTNNDTLNGKPVDPKDITVKPGTPVDENGKPTGKITMTPDGVITIAPETPAGEYKFPYTICEVLNPKNCDDAIVTIVVDPAPIAAEDDNFGPFNGKDGGKTPPVTNNDTLNGKPVDPKDITVKPGTPVDENGKPTGKITMTPDGVITIAPETPAGEYKFPYTICEVLNPKNCDDAIVTIVVDPAPIAAEDDNFGPFNGKDGGKTPPVTNNDTLNGKPVDPKDITVKPGTPVDENGKPTGKITMTPDGVITIAPETPAGEYKFPYTICEVLNPKNCDDAIVTIVVDPAPIAAEDDNFGPFNGKDGGKTAPVTNNDTLNGKPVDPKDITVKPGTPVDENGKPTGKITMTPDGVITIAPETPAGEYKFPYTICEVLNPKNCDDAIVTIVVDPAPIEAEDDNFGPFNGKDGGKTPPVTNNDTLNGKPVDPKDITVKPGTPVDENGKPTGKITMTPDGVITIAPETPAGEYKFPYTICEVLNPTNCDNAVITITVVAPEIKAVDDEYGPYNGKDGGETASVFENDLLNKVKLNPNDIELTAGVPVNGAGEEIHGLIMNKNGKIKVEKETAAGKYYYPYKITEKLNPDNFDDAVAIVTVIEAPIKANDDRYQINGKNGGTTSTVIENDKLNGKTIDPKEIELKIGKPTDLEGKPTTVVTMNPDGTITVAPNTPKGTYLYPYTICEVLNPTNCSSAVARIEILPAPIVATDDSYKVEWTRESVTTASVLPNDKYNGKPVDLDEVTLLPGVPSNPGLSMNPDGTITIAPSTRPGTYTYPYTICEVLNPTNCSTAVATIVIEASDVFIPNTFTPNGDGVNDKFEIVGIENFDNVSVTIVNRWGNEVYRNDSYNNEWNGSGLNEGTYYYIVTLRKGTTEKVHKGWVLIKTR